MIHALLTFAAAFALIVRAEVVGADLVDDERRASWETWREEPLDLERATSDEIASLPGADESIAAAVIALRDLGRLRSLDDLRAVSGLDDERRAEWSDLVVFGASDPDGGSSWSTDLRIWTEVERDDRPRTSSTLRTDLGPVSTSWRIGPASSPSGVTVVARSGAFSLAYGAVRLAGGDGLAFVDGVPRTRTAPARGPSVPRMVVSSPASLEGGASTLALGLAHARVQAHVLHVASLARTRGALAIGFGATEIGASCSLEAESMRPAVWVRRSLDAWQTWIALAGTGTATISSAGLSRSGPGWRVGAAWTRADAPGSAGVDPIGGARLDRPHRAVQLEAARRERDWSIEALWRRTERGRPGDTSLAERMRLRWRWRPPSSARVPDLRVVLDLGTDEVVDGDPPTSASLRAVLESRSRSGEWRMTWRRSGSPGRRQDAVALRWHRPSRVALTLALALAAGQQSSPWSVWRPGAGSSPLWIEPGGVGVTAGLRTSVAPGAELGVWTWWREGPARGGQSGIGLAVRVRSGRPGANVAEGGR